MRCLCGSLLPVLLAAPLSAAEPAVRAVNVRGLQVGGTTTVTVDGDDLKAARLLLPFPAKQTLGPKSTDKQAVFDVTLAADVTPGLYQLRLVTDGGVSLPVVVGVDALPQRPFAAKVEALPAALHGTVGGAAVLETTFAGKAGQKVVVEVEAQRLGSKLRPVVHLSAGKRQLGWAWGTPALGGDTRLTATLPEDGSYTVSVHDAEYAAPAPGFFRLKLGEWQYVDQVFPPAVGPGTKAVELIGGTTTTAERPAGGGPFAPVPWPAAGTWSGPRPFVEVSARPEFVADGPASPALPTAPFGLCGKLTKPLEERRFRVPVEPRTRVRFEVFAERIGSPADLALVVRNEAGAEVARAEDAPGTLDPVIEYAVPDKVSAVQVCVAEARGGPPAVYRLTADVVKGAGLGDFRLTTPAQRLSLPAGGRAVVPVYVDRRGYAGPIELSAVAVATEPGVIPADADGALVTVRRGELAGAVIAGLRGRADGTDRPVTLRGHPLERLQPWLATEFAVAPTAANAADFALDWRGLPDTAALVPGLKLALPVKVTRPDATTAVRLTLLTSQPPPVQANGQPNPNAAIRPEKAVELGAKVADGEMVVLLPPDLPASAYDLALQAELLTPDKQRVLATAYTPVRRVPVRLPVAVKVAAAKVEAKAGATVEVKGEVVRAEGVTGDVVVTLAGLPAGLTTAPVTVKAADSAFAVRLAVPANQPAGEVGDLKLSATVAPDPKQPTARAKSRDTAVSLVVLPAAK